MKNILITRLLVKQYVLNDNHIIDIYDFKRIGVIMKITELNDIDLVRHYELARKKADRRINKPDYEDVFNYEVKPYLLEMEKRGII